MSKRGTICDCGKAMISTYFISYKEYWCWNCGNAEELFNGCENRDLTEDEMKELDLKMKESFDFRDAYGSINSGGKREIDGKTVPFDKFPEDLKEKMLVDIKSWKYNE